MTPVDIANDVRLGLDAKKRIAEAGIDLRTAEEEIIYIYKNIKLTLLRLIRSVLRNNGAALARDFKEFTEYLRDLSKKEDILHEDTRLRLNNLAKEIETSIAKIELAYKSERMLLDKRNIILGYIKNRLEKTVLADLKNQGEELGRLEEEITRMFAKK